MTYRFRDRAGVQSVAVDMVAITAELTRTGVDGSWPFQLEIAYPITDE
jgi:hypothetical protein